MENKIVDCDKCSHNTVCAFNVQMDKFKEKISEIEPEGVTKALFYVEVKCRYFITESQSRAFDPSPLMEQWRRQYSYGSGPFFK